MKKTVFSDKNKELFILFRYLILLGLVFSLPIIYKIFTPLTIFFSSEVLGLFYEITVVNDLITYNSVVIQIIAACIAGSAYLLLLILNLTTSISIKRRIYSIIFMVPLFFILNVFRIVVLAAFAFGKSPLFDITHKLFWYILSTVWLL